MRCWLLLFVSSSGLSLGQESDDRERRRKVVATADRLMWAVEEELRKPGADPSDQGLGEWRIVRV